jgi:hypothetical protein
VKLESWRQRILRECYGDLGNTLIHIGRQIDAATDAALKVELGEISSLVGDAMDDLYDLLSREGWQDE